MENNFNHLNPDDFWPEAEKLIDGHFRKKKLIRIGSYSAIALAVVGLIGYFTLQHSHLLQTKNVISGDKNIATIQENGDDNSITSADRLNSTSGKTTASNNTSSVSAIEKNNNTSNSTTATHSFSNPSSAEKSGNTSLASADIMISKPASSSSSVKGKFSSSEKRTASTLSLNENSSSKKKNAISSDNTMIKGKEKKNNSTSTAEQSEKNILASATPINPQTGNSIVSSKKNFTSSGVGKDDNTTPSSPEKQLSDELRNVFSEPSKASTKEDPSFIAFLEKASADLSISESETMIRSKSYPVPTKKHIYSSWYVNLYSIFSMSKNSISSSSYYEYSARRKAEEKSAFAPGLGLTTTYRRNKLSITTGMEYTNHTFQTKYSSFFYKNVVASGQSWDYDTINYIVTDYAFINGVPWEFYRNVTITDSSYVTYFDTTYQKAYGPVSNGKVELRYIEIPLQVSYQLNHRRLGIALSAGVSAAFLNEKKGSVLKTDESGLQDISNSNAFRSMIWNARTGIDLSYQLSDRTAILISPQYRFGLQSVYKSSEGIDQRNSSISIIGGLRYLIH